MMKAQNAWVVEEFSQVDLGDSRLNDRFRSIILDLSRHCSKTLASSFDGWSKIKASYRFFSNPKVKEQAMLAPHIASSERRIRDQPIALLLQDSTYLDYSSRKKTADLDLITQRCKHANASKGLILHNTLAVTVEGLPLGIIDQRFVDRKVFYNEDVDDYKNSGRHRKLGIESKESARWIDVLKTVQKMNFGSTKIVHVADRECDIYEFFRDAKSLKQDVLIRASRNRAIDKKSRREKPSCLLFDKIMSLRSQGSMSVRIQTNGIHKYREAKLSIARMTFDMPPPPNKTVRKDGDYLPMVKLTAILAIERKPPEGEKQLQWVLITNLQVDNLEQAIEKVRWYSTRWNVEVFHKILKSGCGVEKAQLHNAERLKKYAVLKSIVAWRIFWLSRVHHRDPKAPCDEALSREEWILLYKKTHKTNKAPDAVPSIGEAIDWISRLGGYIGRASDPPPGVVSLWRGWQRLSEMVDDFRDIYG